MINSVGGRKVTICAVAIVVCIGVVLLKGDVPSGLASMLQFIVGTYIAGNVGADLVAAKKAGDEAKASEAVNPLGVPVLETELHALAVQLDTVQSTVNELTSATALNQQGIATIIQIAQGRPPQRSA